jgi:MarR family transcriptional regulator, organic hydroperoxide resistance regulator
VRDQFRGEGIVLDNALAFVIHHLYQRIRSEGYRAFNEHGVEITPEQWMVLVRLWERGELTPSELSDSTHKDRPTTTRILQTMETHGLVERRTDASDKRQRMVRLTAHGKALRKKLVPVAQDLVERLERGIPERDLQCTRQTLRRMLENLE